MDPSQDRRQGILSDKAAWDSSRTPLAERGSWTLRPAQSPLAGASAWTLFALIWTVPLGSAILSLWRQHGAGAGGFILVLSLFLLLGSAIALVALHFLLRALFSPRVELAIATPALQAGTGHVIQWTVTRGRQRLSSLKLTLVLREQCRYRSGTDTITDRRQVSRHVLAEYGEPAASGRCQLALPTGIAPSFSSDSNQLVWVLMVRGSVRGLPDVADEYPLRIVAEAPSAKPLVATLRYDDTPLADRLHVIELAEPGTPLRAGQPRAAVVGARQPATLRLGWKTSGKGDTCSGIAAELALAAGCSAVVLTLPSTPPAWHGSILSLIWQLELLTADHTLCRVLSVSPPSATIAAHDDAAA